MASRQRRRFLEANKTPDILKEEINEEDLIPNAEAQSSTRQNLFMALQGSESETEEKVEETQVQPLAEIVQKRSKKSKARNKKKQNASSLSNSESDKNSISEGTEDIDKIVEEINTKYGCLEASEPGPSTSVKKSVNHLIIRRNHLHYVNELTKIFGETTLEEEVNLKRGRYGSMLCHRIDKWPTIQGTKGLSMVLDRTEHGVNYFKFEHTPEYKMGLVQMVNVVDMKEAHDIFVDYQYNLGCILQFLEICYNVPTPEERQHELIDSLESRGLLVSEFCFHDQFKITRDGRRLEYKYQTNRMFYALLFKKMLLCHRFICYRTALEYAKLIRSLDSVDVLGIHLCLDHYALKSREYKWLIDTVNARSTNHTCEPNMMYSVALAKYNLSKKRDSTEASDLLLKAVSAFPEIAHCLLDKIHTKYQEDIEEKNFFKAFYDKLDLCTLKTICFIYSSNMQGLWNEVNEWFFSVIRKAYQLLKDPTVSRNHLKGGHLRVWCCMLPTSYLRYCSLVGDELKEHIMQYQIAKDELHLDRFWWDPFPPEESVNIYRKDLIQGRHNPDRMMARLRHLHMFMEGPDFQNIVRRILGIGERE